MREHNAELGHLDHCQITGSKNLFEVIDLGHQPPCAALLTKDDLNRQESTYPLRLMLCPESGLAQLDFVLPPEIVYPKDYCYRAGISWTVVEAHRQMAQLLMSMYNPQFCVDIGCNDGAFLAEMKAVGCPQVLGVEPTDVARFAEERGVPVYQAFFTPNTAEMILSSALLGGKQADLIVMTNVFAHMADLGTVMEGLCKLLSAGGVLVVENQYLLDMLEKAQFDGIYHEHIRTYSLRALRALFGMYGMEVFRAERVPRYAGNIRVYVGWKGAHVVSPSVENLARREEEDRLFDPATWAWWRSRVQRNRADFMEWAYQMKRYGLSVAGCSAPGRASTLLNYYGVTPDLMQYTGELSDSLKLDRYLPGCHIPVIDNKALIEDQPDFIVLLAWHYRNEIAARLRKEGVRSKLVMPMPCFAVLPEEHHGA